MDDAQLIKDLGGPAVLARKLGYDTDNGGVQRVQNWLTRGIPPKVKLERPDLFLQSQVAQASPPTQPADSVAKAA